MGHEFTSLVLALLQVGGYPPKVDEAVLRQIRELDGDFEFEIYVSLTCHNCPDVVQALNLMAIQNPRIKTTMIDGALFQDEVKERQIMAVPTVFLNGTHFGQGRMSLEEILAKIDTGGSRARSGEDRRQGTLRRADRRRRSRGRRGRGVRGAQGHPHRRRVGALRRPGAGHAGHRELRLRQGNRRAQVRPRAGGTRAPLRRGHHEPAARQGAGAGFRPDRGAAGKRRRAQVAHRHHYHRRALAQHQRAGREGIPQQGSRVLPALRRPACSRASASP